MKSRQIKVTTNEGAIMNNLPDLADLGKPKPTVPISLAVLAPYFPTPDHPFDGNVMDGECLAQMFRAVVREELDRGPGCYNDQHVVLGDSRMCVCGLLRVVGAAGS